MDQTRFFSLPYMAAAQAQKHLTHNEALRRIDQCIQIAVASRASPLAPPGSPADGERYLVPDGAGGAWTGQDGKLATWIDGAWSYIVPAAGWIVWVEDEALLLIHDGDGFTALQAGRFDDLTHMGIGTMADETNRLAVASPASLFTHAGAGHRLTLNKATADETASVVFQSDWSGRAEFGLTGDNDWHVKVSSDGNEWREAMRVSANTAQAAFPAGVYLGHGGNLLDHYEDGTWIPELEGALMAGSPVYSANAGSFVRIGALVHATGRLAWTSLGGATGAMSITSLPFACRPGLNHRAPMVTSWYNSLAMDAGTTMLGGFTEPGRNSIRLWGAKNAHEGTNVLLNQAHLTEAGEIYFSCTYLT